MARQRKSYTAEFKVQAVRMVTDQKLSVAEAARRLGINENLLRLLRAERDLLKKAAAYFASPTANRSISAVSETSPSAAITSC
jgi:transposase